MTCDLAIRRGAPTGGGPPTYLLRVATRRVLGSAGVPSRHTLEFTGAEALTAFLRGNLDLPDPVVQLALEAIGDATPSAPRFTVFASDIDIPFATLEAADALPFE